MTLAGQGWQQQMFAQLLETAGDDCLLWPGEQYPKTGYGRVKLNGVAMGVHRAAYILKRGVLSPQLAIHHLCGVRLCFNPQHLEPMSKSDHSKLHKPRQIVCKRGHALTVENIMLHRSSRNALRIERRCLTCHKLRNARADRAVEWRRLVESGGGC